MTLVRRFDHKGNQTNIVVDGDLIIVSNRFACLRIELGHGKDDEESMAWLRKPVTDIESFQRYAFEKSQPQVCEEFDSDAWVAWCETRGDAIDDEMYDVSDAAEEEGYGAWIATLELYKTRPWAVAAVDAQTTFWRYPDDDVNLIDAARAFAAATPASQPLTINQVATSAYMAQDAVNLSGLVRSWAEWMPVINRHAEELGIPRNQHAINVIMVDKLIQLSSHNDTTAIEAMGIVRRMAEKR